MTRPPWFDEALREMRETGRAGLALVVDPLDLQDSIGHGRLDPLRRRAVVVVMSAAAARSCIAGLPEGHTLALLDAEGRLLRSSDGDVPGGLEKLLGKGDVEKSAPLRELPYGVEWAEGQHHELFGTTYDPCPPCGMPQVSNNSSRLIRYLRLLDR